jgi:hypothetical protein
MDDLFDDPLDITSPEGILLAAGAGLLDGDERCSCTCGCERPVEWAGDECDACQDGRHADPFDPDDKR